MRTGRLGLLVGAGIAALAGGGLGSAHGQTFSGTFNNPATLNLDQVSVSFSVITGGPTNILQVILSNNSTFDDWGNNDVLSGVFWDIAGGGLTLTPVSAIADAIANPGECVSGQIAFCSAPPVDVGQEFAYQYSASGFDAPGLLTTTSRYGIASSGYSTGLMVPNFGPGNTDPFGSGPDLSGGGAGVGGLDFGIISNTYQAAQSTNSVQSTPLSQGSVTFKFNLPTGVSTVAISNVTFGFGTAPDASTSANAPEPATLATLVIGLGGVMLAHRSRRRRTGHDPRP